MTLEYGRKINVNVNKILLIFTASLLLVGIIWWITHSIKEHHAQDDPMLFKLKQIMETTTPRSQKSQTIQRR